MPSSPPAKQSRPKPTRSSSSKHPTGTVRQRSPGAHDDHDTSDGRAPPTKRARKAINCEPCRTSKLKCDRARPCSSCVLRGTVGQCYQGADGLPITRDDTPIDPAAEFTRLRQALSLLETHYLQSSASKQPSPISYTPDSATQTSRLPPTKYEEVDATKCDAPGMHGRQGQSGFYTGPTSTASHLIIDENLRSRTSSEELQNNKAQFLQHDYDRDLIELLPPLHIIDALLDYYFEYCNWIYRHITQKSFQSAWQDYKDGKTPDRIVLATAAVLTGLAIRYLPPGHELLASLPGPFANETHYMDLSLQYFEVMKKALRRYQDDTKVYTLDLVELQLVRCHYLTFTKTDPEEIWAVRGELVTIATAMGLHRDPGKSRHSLFTAERRRWAWWHIVLLERWQAFMFGRPLAFASHHFNTLLPSYCDPEIESGRLFLPNIALFRLAFILGEIMTDAVSLRPVSYESFQAKDRLLTGWLESLPPELDLDEFRMARSLSSPITSVRRLGVQSIIIRTAYYHIRFTLHRPFAGVKESKKMNESLEVAVASADKLLSLAAQTTPEVLATNSGASILSPIHGHLNWRPFHVFSAAMFFTFQLIQAPDQLGASLFRSYVRRSLGFLEQSRKMPVSEKALTVLVTLAPLYSEDFLALSPQDREKEKASILSTVKTLAFPYQDPPQATKFSESPMNFGPTSFVTNKSDVGSPVGVVNNYSSLDATNQYGSGSSSSLSTMPSYPTVPAPVTQEYSSVRTLIEPLSAATYQPTPLQQAQAPPHSYSASSSAMYMQQQQYQQQQFLYGDSAGPTKANMFVAAADDWSGPAGFGQREWMRFMDVMQRPSDGCQDPCL